MPQELIDALFEAGVSRRRWIVPETRAKMKNIAYLEPDHFIYPINGYEMPATDLSNVPYKIRDNVERGIEKARKRDPVGIYEERKDGKVPVNVDTTKRYAGVTEIESFRGKPRAKRIGLNNRLKPKDAERVAEHEARHVRSECLLDYADVSENMVTRIMESYAEFGRIKASKKEGRGYEVDEIIDKTPYPHHIKFGIIVDKMYCSNYDGVKGYAAFIRDIQTNQSMKKTLQTLGANIRENMEKYKGLMNNIRTRKDLRKAA